LSSGKVEMATLTFGTAATTSLTAVPYASSISAADFATIAQGIQDDRVNVAGSHPILNEAFMRSGLLLVPNRGILKVLDGDYVAIDNNGWPILVSADSVNYGLSLWVHS
jgi:hypothetical protein